jgi:hypothetical protein
MPRFSGSNRFLDLPPLPLDGGREAGADAGSIPAV